MWKIIIVLYFYIKFFHIYLTFLIKHQIMKKLLFLLSLFFTTVNSFSQSLETIDWGTYTELPKFSLYQKIIGGNDDGFYALKTINQDIYLDFVSSTTMSVDASNQLLLPTVNGIQTKFEDIFYVNNQLILFTSATNTAAGKKFVYIMYVKGDGTLKNKPKKVGEISVSNNPADSFNFLLSPNQKQIYLYYHTTYKTYNGEPFTVKSFDSSLQPILDSNFKLPFKDTHVEITKYLVGNSGNFYMMAKSEQVTKRKSSRSKGPKYDFTVLAFNAKTKGLKSYKIKILKYIPHSATFGLDKEENIVVVGLSAAKTSRVAGQFTGAFYKKFDPRIQKEIPVGAKDFFIIFDKASASRLLTKRNGDTPEKQYNYILKNVKFLANGSVIMLAEQYNESYKIITDPATKADTKIIYYNFNDILAIGINNKGKMEWNKQIPKNQKSIDDNGYYHSYYCSVVDNKLKVIYNDNSSNKKDTPDNKIKPLKNNPNKTPKGMAFIVTIYTDGSFEKDAMFPDKDKKTVIVPRLIKKIGDFYYTYGQNGKNFKFGRFVMD